MSHKVHFSTCFAWIAFLLFWLFCWTELCRKLLCKCKRKRVWKECQKAYLKNYRFFYIYLIFVLSHHLLLYFIHHPSSSTQSSFGKMISLSTLLSFLYRTKHHRIIVFCFRFWILFDTLTLTSVSRCILSKCTEPDLNQ